MSFADVKAKTTFTGFDAGEQTTILAAMQASYDGSATSKAMMDTWIATPGNTIDISEVPNVFQAYTLAGKGTGDVEIDLTYITNSTYINNTGKAVAATLTHALTHELGHGLTGKRDTWSATDYKGDNVVYTNKMLKELGEHERNSYISFDRTGTDLVLNREFTNGATIDASYYFSGNDNWSSAALGNSKDLLIGNSLANILQSGEGDDFLVGNKGNDELNGGDGRDTAVYFGNPVDYDIRQNKDSTWTVKHVRGSKDEGVDTLKNIEILQFGAKTYELRKSGLTFQTDFALVIDTTGSMGSSIGSVQTQATAIINGLFSGGTIDARIGVVTFRDTTIGEPTTAVLKFTEDDEFASRQSKALSAINSIGVGGGGDLPESAFDGLLKALDGTTGEWRAGAGTHRIALFTDAAPKDFNLLPQVALLAASIGASVSFSSSTMGVSSAIDTFELTFSGSTSAAEGFGGDDDPNANPLPPFVPSDTPVTPDTTTASLAIYTIFTGPSGVDTSKFQEISNLTNGAFLTATTGDDLVKALLDIVNGLDLVGTPDPDILVGGEFIDKLTGLADDDMLDGGLNADSMAGGPGNDTYTVDNSKDSVTEQAGEGTADTVRSSLDFYTLPANVENGIILKDSGASLKGNELANELKGSLGNDSLTGASGDDTLTGGGGNDALFGGTSSTLSLGSGQFTRGVGAGNNSIATAINVSSMFSFANDPDILNSTTVPHVSIEGTGDGSIQYFAVNLGTVGAIITVDVDYTNSYDSYLALYNSAGKLLTTADDSSTSSGAGGSTSGLDSFLQYTTTSAETFYIAIGRFSGPANLQNGDKYEMQVSISGESLNSAGAGHDIAIYNGPRIDYNIALASGGTLTVDDKVGGRDGSDTVNGIDYLKFTDKTIIVANLDDANIARLYSAALDRAPDILGLNGWTDFYATGISGVAKSQGVYVALAQTPLAINGLSIAGGFTASPEFMTKYGALNNTQYITLLYNNVLDRDPALVEVSAWNDLMTKGDVTGQIFSREMVLVGFAESPENIAKTAADWLIQI